MLGWEFPPVLTGGLGQACYGLFSALSQQAGLKIILPASHPNFPLENAEIIGLNNLQLEYEELLSELYKRYDSLPIYLSQIGFSPYPIYPRHYFAKAITSSLQVATAPQLDTPITISPPPTASDTSEDSIQDNVVDIEVRRRENSSLLTEAIREFYPTLEPYGPNIMDKVALYADVTDRIASSTDFDYIHAHDWMTFPAAVQIKESTGKPLVVHVHSLETDRLSEDTVDKAHNDIYQIELTAMQQADAVITVSDFAKENIIAHYDIEPEKIFAIHNAPSPVAPYRSKRKIRDKIVLFLGRITYQKGPDYLLETVTKVVQVDPKVKFVVVGTGDDFERIVERSAQLRLSKYIVFTGFLSREKVTSLLSQADVYFMPSVSEPFGLSALEAAQFGIPCVLSNQSGVVELLHNVLKADYWDTNRFANYIYALLHYEGLRMELLQNNQEELKHINWDQSAQQVMDIYSYL